MRASFDILDSKTAETLRSIPLDTGDLLPADGIQLRPEQIADLLQQHPNTLCVINVRP